MALEEFRIRFGKAMMELVGTAIFVMTIQIAVSTNMNAAPLAIGFMLIALVYAGGPISGAHYNPAISFAVFLRGKLALQQMLLFWVCQIAGAVLGALLGAAITGHLGAIQLGKGHFLLQAFLAEFVFTALLCFVVLATATSSAVENNSYYGAAIGVVVLVGIITVGDISGGAFNPAVVLGLGLIKHFWKLPYMLWIILANMLGSIAGAMVYYIVAPDEFQHFGDEAHNLGAEARALLPSSS